MTYSEGAHGLRRRFRLAAPIRAVDDYFDFLRLALLGGRPRPIFFANADRCAE